MAEFKRKASRVLGRELTVVIIDGCQVGLQDERGRFRNQAWGVLTADRRFAGGMPLRCARSYACGTLDWASQLTHYPDPIIKRVVKGFAENLIHDHHVCEFGVNASLHSIIVNKGRAFAVERTATRLTCRCEKATEETIV